MSASAEVLSLIPHRPPFLFVDEVVAHTGESLTARRTWRADESFYAGHYPGAPITPGVLLCEAVFQAGAILMAKLMAAAADAGRAGAASAPAGTPTGASQGVPLLTKVTEVRFRLPVYPGDTVLIEVKRKESAAGFHFMSGAITRDGKKVLNLEFSVAWKAPEGAPTS